MSYQNAISLIGQNRANPSDYQVVLPPKVTDFASKSDFSQYITYFTRAITLPGMNNSATALTGQENLGIQRNVITGRSYGSPVVMTITDRSDLLVYTTLKGWMDSSIINSDQQGSRHLRSNYYDSIKCQIDIIKLEPKRNIKDPRTDSQMGHMATGVWSLINCVPLSIEQTSMGVDSADALLDFTISIAFESFKYNKLDNLENQSLLDVTQELLNGNIVPLTNRR